MKHFGDFDLKAVDMSAHLRTNLSTFPALEKMNADVTLPSEKPRKINMSV